MPQEAVSSKPVNTQAGQTRPAGAAPPGVGGAVGATDPPGYAECHYCTVVKKRRSLRCRRCVGQLDLRERFIRAAEDRPRRRVGSVLSLLFPGLGHAWSANPAGGLFYFAVVAIVIAYYTTLKVEPNAGRWMTIGALALIWVIAALDAARGQAEVRPPCQEACPAHLACMHYVTHIREGRFLASLEQIMHLCPTAGEHGRVCHHPCGGLPARPRGRADRNLRPQALRRRRPSRGGARLLSFGRSRAGARDRRRRRRSVGTSAALVLRIMGFAVTLFEAEAEAGGMPGAAIPDYQMPKEIYRREVGAMLESGIERLRAPARQGFSARGSGGRRDLRGVSRARLSAHRTAAALRPARTGVPRRLDLLKQAKLGAAQPLGGQALVIGGGNVAMDVAKTALRLGASAVHVIFLESRETMPAHTWECDEALVEGVMLVPSSATVSFEVVDGRVASALCKRVERIESTRKTHPACALGGDNSRFLRRPCSARSVPPRLRHFPPPRRRAPRSGRGRSWRACPRRRGSRSRCSMAGTTCPARLR